MGAFRIGNIDRTYTDVEYSDVPHHSTTDAYMNNYAEATATIGSSAMKAFNSAATVLSSLASLLFGVMWGTIILATASAVTGILAFHKAGTLRRDEIIDELRKNKKGANNQ